MDHTAHLVQRREGKNLLSTQAQIHFEGVFNDRFAVSRRHPEQGPAMRYARGRSHRVVKSWNRVESLDLGTRQQSIERIEVGSVRIHRHFRRAHSKTHQGAEHVVVSRGFDRNCVPLRREQPNRESDPLARTMTQYDLACGDGNIRFAQSLRDRIAQAQMTLGVAVQKQFRPTPVQHMFETAPKFFDRIERGFGHQRVQRYRVVDRRVSGAPRVEVQQLFDLCAQRHRDLFGFGAFPAHKGSATYGGFDQSVGGEGFVRHRNCVPVDPEILRECANCRQSRSRSNLARFDLKPQLARDLLVYRKVRLTGMIEVGKTHRASLRSGQYSVNAQTIPISSSQITITRARGSPEPRQSGETAIRLDLWQPLEQGDDPPPQHQHRGPIRLLR